MTKVICGDANPKGNIQFTYKGGCRKEIKMKDAYRCTGCGGWFCLEHILEHFKREKEHDVGRNELKTTLRKYIKENFPISSLRRKLLIRIKKI